MQEVFDAAQSADLAADRFDQAARTGIDPALRDEVARQIGQKSGGEIFIRWSVTRLERRQGGRHGIHAGILSPSR